MDFNNKVSKKDMNTVFQQKQKNKIPKNQDKYSPKSPKKTKDTCHYQRKN